MAGLNEIEVLKTMSSAIEESHLQVVTSSYCYKAQTKLANNIKTQIDLYKERCSSVYASNLKQNSEIRLAQEHISSSLVTQETVRRACVDLKMELMLTKERQLKVLERIEKGVKKYEDIWLDSKARFESLPFVQNLLKAKEEVQNIKQHIIELENEEKIIFQKIETKTQSCREMDQKRIVALAEYMVVERPKLIKSIIEKSAAIKEIEKELNNSEPNINDKANENEQLNVDNACTSIMPKLQLNYFNTDMNENPEKIGNDDLFTRTPEKTYSVHSILVIDPSKVNKKKTEITQEEYISSFFYKPKYEANKKRNYAKMKLINILDDIKLDNNEALNYLTEANPNALQPIDSIAAADHLNIEENNGITNVEDIPGNEEIEEVEMTVSGVGNILPPTQFLDVKPNLKEDQSQKYSQEESSNKKVKFDLPNEIEKPEIIKTKGEDNPEHNYTSPNVTVTSQLDTSDKEFDEMQDMIMKKHQLDLSPQFVYAKNIMAPLVANTEDEVITSKFFPQEENQINAKVEFKTIENKVNDVEQSLLAKEVSTVPMDIDKEPTEFVQENIIMEGPIQDKETNSQKETVTMLSEVERPVSGYIFTQNTQLTSDILDDSANATGFEIDFTSSLDTSILQSPKADISLPNVDSQEVISQDVPSFLAGLRKTGFSFFGGPSEPKPDSSGQSQNHSSTGFSFNFKNEEKKNRGGGLFSMFQ